MLKPLQVLVAASILLPAVARAQAPQNLLPDPSIEQSQPKNQFGNPFVLWSGNIFEGAAEFRAGRISHSGQSSAEIIGAPGAKIRLFSPTVSLEPGRYRFSCFIRGLDIGAHAWGLSEDVNFVDEEYHALKKVGTFGWTKLEIVKDVPKKQDVTFRIGLWATGRLWVDDAKLERVGPDTPLSNGPILGVEEKPIAPPGALDAAKAINCPDCGYRNMPGWGKCYVCGTPLQVLEGPQTPPTRALADFEKGAAPFEPGDGISITGEHATEGKSALRLEKGYASWSGGQNWSGYDFLKADVFNASDDPARVYVEIHDKSTTGYWTRVNYTTVVPPGASTLLVPTDIYVGEKSRPGHALDLANITRLVFALEEPKAPLFLDNLRLERDLSDSVKVPGLRAFSFGPGTSPPLRGFTSVSPSTLYSPGRGFGLQDARIWKAFDVLQPDPLYSRFICIEGGGFALDVPDGKYHVFLNIDSPGGFWGENQLFRERSIRANGLQVLDEKMDLERFKARYFRFANVEDTLAENTFDKYLSAIFHEKEFDVEVRGGKLFLEFNGANWANCLSALVIYPASQAEAGRKYLQNLRERRRFYFDNYFKRVAPNGARDSRGMIPAFVPTGAEKTAGYVLFSRDWMENVPVSAVPRREEVGRSLQAFASAGEMEPIVFSLRGLRDRGEVKISVSDLVSAAGKIPASAIVLGVVSHRLTRLTGDGTIYTIAPRFVMARDSATVRAGETTTFWLTLHAPKSLQAGTYKGRITLKFADGKTDTLDLSARLFATPLDELDVAAGPWGSTLDIPWYGEETGATNRAMFQKSLAKMREYGFTTFSGIPTLRISGWKDKVPQIDFAQADQQMQDARAAGFRRIVVNYNGGIQGFDNYKIDSDAMKAAGFDKYTDFLRAVLGPIAAHAKAANWLPVAFNLCDEPIGDAAAASEANARAWREAAPEGIITTGATSVETAEANDAHLKLAQALKIANLSLHNAASVKAIHDAGSDWSYYNDGSRWTFGTYMFKATRDFGMKYRLEWYWNAAAGDPYYALDSREDDYAWVATNARGDLIQTIKMERDMREGIDDYKYLQTLSRLLREKPNHPAAPAARRLLEDKLASFALGERSPKGALTEFRDYRLRLAEAIEQMAS